MTIQDQDDVPHSSMLLSGGNRISLDAGAQMLSGEGQFPKIRKPYTITKQRERWTEEEHNKFLEALKLYGRAWRKIEEHIGTKTAVQIRSHAQKFFSKVVRESSNSNSSLLEPIDIPPPRPKRKPVHPYPRKLVTPAKTKLPLQEQSSRSVSPNSSVDEENHSPTSVLSAIPSDTSGSADLDTHDASSSPVSCLDDFNRPAYLPSEDDPSGKENISQLGEPISTKLELFPNFDSFGKASSVEDTSTKSLKLFGQTLSVRQIEKPCSSSSFSGKTKSLNIEEASGPEIADVAASAENSSSLLSPAVLPATWYMNANSQPMEVGPSASQPWCALYGGMRFSFIPLNIVNLTNVDIQRQGDAE